MSEPAFPTGVKASDGPFGGMTLRDYFAAAALTGMLAQEYGRPADVAVCAYAFARAMLIERAKEGT